jgi:universal stress protein A
MTASFPPRRILVPLDFSDQARKSLNYAVRMALELKAKLVVLHVGPPIPTFAYPLPEATALQTAQWTETLRERQESARQALEDEIRPWFDSVEFEIQFEEGEATDAIVRSADEFECTLIVMGSHGRTGLKRVLLGSVAEKTVRLAHVPVLIVH